LQESFGWGGGGGGGGGGKKKKKKGGGGKREIGEGFSTPVLRLPADLIRKRELERGIYFYYQSNTAGSGRKGGGREFHLSAEEGKSLGGRILSTTEKGEGRTEVSPGFLHVPKKKKKRGNDLNLSLVRQGGGGGDKHSTFGKTVQGKGGGSTVGPGKRLGF